MSSDTPTGERCKCGNERGHPCHSDDEGNYLYEPRFSPAHPDDDHAYAPVQPVTETPTGERLCAECGEPGMLYERPAERRWVHKDRSAGREHDFVAPVRPVAETRERTYEDEPKVGHMVNLLNNLANMEGTSGRGYHARCLQRAAEIVTAASRPIADKTFGELLDALIEASVRGEHGSVKARQAFPATRAAVEAEYERVRGERDSAQVFAMELDERALEMEDVLSEVEGDDLLGKVCALMQDAADSAALQQARDLSTRRDELEELQARLIARIRHLEDGGDFL